MDMLQTFRFCQAVSVPTHRCGHTLDLVVHREEDSLFCSVSVCHSLSSDHLPEMCSLNILKPEFCPVLQTTRNLRAIDREHFRQDVASLTTVQPDITADQFNTQMRRLLDTHAPSTQRQATRHGRSPLYFSIASELRSMKQERRRAERRMLSTKLTIRKEIMNSVKIHLVGNAKSTFCSVKVSTSSTVKEFYKVTNNLLGKICVQETVLKFIPLVHPCVDLRESPMKLC